MSTQDKRPRIGIVDGGMAYHIDSYERDPLKGWFDRVIYLRDLPLEDLGDLDILVVPCRTNPHWLAQVSGRLQAFMRRGGTLAVMGETRPDMWLPEVGFRPVETNFWWWLEPGADLGIQMKVPGHSMHDYISRAAATFHLHSVFEPQAPNQLSLIETKDGECLMFEDTETYAPGRLVATTLDPFFHHGQFFMPATTEFLKGFMPWIAASHEGSEKTEAAA